MRRILIAAASIAAVGHSVTRPPGLLDLDDGVDLFPHPFPNLLPEPLSATESERYTEYLRAHAGAKRERKRFKAMGVKK